MQNPIVVQLTKAITPVISIGVGSAICTVCQRNRINPELMTKEQLPVVKRGLVEHYQKFWPNRVTEVTAALGSVSA